MLNVKNTTNGVYLFFSFVMVVVPVSAVVSSIMIQLLSLCSSRFGSVRFGLLCFVSNKNTR